MRAPESVDDKALQNVMASSAPNASCGHCTGVCPEWRRAEIFAGPSGLPQIVGLASWFGDGPHPEQGFRARLCIVSHLRPFGTVCLKRTATQAHEMGF
jgi:hypothetical protein